MISACQHFQKRKWGWRRIDLLTQRIKSVEDTLKAHRDVSERLAVIETRQATHGQLIANTQNEISELRHGEGFIRGPRGIDREYP